jgi:hypothetical protein
MTHHYEHFLNLMESEGRRLFGPDFEFYEIDRPVVHKLLVYMLHDEAGAEELGMDLRKGIMLSGGYGCGKTTIMKLTHHLCKEPLKPVIKSCKDIRIEFAQRGYEVINRYSFNAFHPYSSVPKIFCFEDLGAETPVSFWGDSVNVMEEILSVRYSLFNSHGMITYVTTSLDSNQLEIEYGKRMRSCMRGMFNLISFDPDSPDKRR